MYNRDTILTVEGMAMLLTGAYDIMSRSGYYGARLYLFEAMKSPDFFIRDVGGGFAFNSEIRFSHTHRTNGNALALWETIYRAIRNLTFLIENIDDVYGDTEELRLIKGQAYLLRGLCYFDLMRLFAFPPIYSMPGHSRYNEMYQWGVPIISPAEKGRNVFNHEVRRETADSTFRFIVEQFELAHLLSQGRAIPQGRANSATAKALLIRTYLYLENWSTVVELGEEWIARYGSRYTMIPWENYPTTYHRPFNSESIWEFSYTTANHLGNSSINFWLRRPTWNEPGSDRDGTVSEILGYARAGLSWGNPTRGLEFLRYYPNDVRQCLIVEMGIEGFPEFYTVRRYVGDPFHSVHNVPVVRLPEIYLSIAEAYANIGNMAQASYYTSLVSVPRRKAETDVTTTVDVLDERRRELILEGHTFWDHFRTARNLPNMQTVVSSTYSPVTVTFPTAGGSLGSRARRAVYAIPLAELNANPIIRNQQNPGYAAWTHVLGEDEEDE
jgi:hypothetical protein